MNTCKYDAVLVVAFGGPEKPDDVIPYLTRVTQGRVPEQRLKAVARHYEIFGGKSPVREITFRQASALEKALKDRATALPVYVGMRHWHPLLADTLGRMKGDGVKRAVVVIMSAFESRAGWDQYKTDMDQAIRQAHDTLQVTYTRPVYDQPGFINTMVNEINGCLENLDPSDREWTFLVFTAHSIPHADPGVSTYAQQIETSATRIAQRLGISQWEIAYQSRSGRPQDPWLEPDVNSVLQDLALQGVKNVIIAPIGFVCDNIEVLYDLGIEARKTAKDTGLGFFLAKTVGEAPAFIDALATLVVEAIEREAGNLRSQI
jgi:protoporphyrin/coproporphyrin ferrochelatase